LNKKLFEERISSKNIFSGKILGLYHDMVRLPNGKIASREKITHPGAVAVVPVTSDNNILLVKQYRYPVSVVTIEIPAGKLAPGENPRECAERELGEEIGAIGGKVQLMSSFYSTPGYCDEVLHLFIATGFQKSSNNLDEDEFLEIIEVKMEKSVIWIKEGKIKDCKTIAGILMARDYLDNK
jgi:ADP-ribose pyrophosphatase